MSTDSKSSLGKTFKAVKLMWLSDDADVGNDDNDLIAVITPAEAFFFFYRVIRSAAATQLSVEHL